MAMQLKGPCKCVRLTALQETVAAGRQSSRAKCSVLSQGKNAKPYAESDGAAFFLQSWSPMNKQSRPQRPHTFRTLEELERQAHKFAGKTVSPWPSFAHVLSCMVARDGTKRARHGLSICVFEVGSGEIAVQIAAIHRSRPGPLLTCRNTVNDDSFNSDCSL